jgi:predicted transcriptional regulator
VREFIRSALAETRYNRHEAARLLGMTPRMIKYYLNERGDEGN